MPTVDEAARFIIEDEVDGWVKLERTGGDSMSLLEREVPELITALQQAAARAACGRRR